MSYRLAIGFGALRARTFFQGLACLAPDLVSLFAESATVVGVALCGGVGDLERAGRKCDREGTTKKKHQRC